MNYQLCLSNKRKTIALQVKQGNLIVRAPSYLSESQIEHFVQTKRKWIEKKLLACQENDTTSFNFVNGEHIYIFGEKRTFLFDQGTDKGVLLTDDILQITLSAREFSSSHRKTYLRKVLITWLQQQVVIYLDNHLESFQRLMGVNITSVKVRLYKSRWGSCNNRKELSFNSLLAMVPKGVIDYVIVHELAHITHMNHSAAFWQCVANYCPNYNNMKVWLKKNQKYLQISS